ncbi:hypothetical protein M1D48_14935 [Erwinia sp. D4-22]
MSFSLPGTDLYYLPRDDLAPERYEEITRPVFSWPKVDSKYVFDDRMHFGFQLINMQQRAFNGYNNQPPPHGPREREKLKRMLFSGEVVMLGGYSFSKGSLFYIDEQGALICRDRLAFKFDGARGIIREYNRSVTRRDYSKRGGKPRPTALPACQPQIKQPAPLSTINSKAAGRLLAAGGMYHGNPDGFRQTAQQLGGEAPAGYDQMMSDQAKGLLIAGASVAAAFGMGRLNPTNAIETLPYLSKQTKPLLSNSVKFETRQLQKKFKHAIDFNVSGNANVEGLKNFEQALRRHIDHPSTHKITGKYRWSQDVYHYYNPETKLDVMTSLDGNFISGWKLSKNQLFNLEGESNVF